MKDVERPDLLPHLLEHIRFVHEDAVSLRQVLHATVTTAVLALSGAVALIGVEVKVLQPHFVALGLSQLVFLLGLVALLVQTNITIHEGYMRAAEDAANDLVRPAKPFHWNSSVAAKFYSGFRSTIIWIDIVIVAVGGLIYLFLLWSFAKTEGTWSWAAWPIGVLELGFVAWTVWRLSNEGQRAYEFAKKTIEIPGCAAANSGPKAA